MAVAFLIQTATNQSEREYRYIIHAYIDLQLWITKITLQYADTYKLDCVLF